MRPHDKLCPSSGPWEAECFCDVIEQVRHDQRQQAVLDNLLSLCELDCEGDRKEAKRRFIKILLTLWSEDLENAG